MTMGNSAIVLYCKTKKRQWSGLCQLYLLVQYVHARPAEVTHCPLEVSKQQNAKILKKQKSCTVCQELVPKKCNSVRWVQERIVLKSLSAAVCGGAVKNR